jgi:hypothetical protein
VRTRATFRLFGNDSDLTAAAVSHQLGVQPTLIGEVGTRVGRRSRVVRAGAVWGVSSGAGIDDDVELADQLDRLLGLLEPHTAALWQLVESGYEANWFCYVASHATEHAVEIERHLMQRLLALPGDLWLDVCGDGEDCWITVPATCPIRRAFAEAGGHSQRNGAKCRRSTSCLVSVMSRSRLPKLIVRVRFSSPAPMLKPRSAAWWASSLCSARVILASTGH